MTQLQDPVNERKGLHILLLNLPNRAKCDISSLRLIIPGGLKLAHHLLPIDLAAARMESMIC